MTAATPATSSELRSLVGGASPPDASLDIEQQQHSHAGRKVRDHADRNVLRRFVSRLACSWGLLATLLWLLLVALYALHVVPFATTHAAPAAGGNAGGGATFRVSFTADAHAGPITGRLLLCLARKHAVDDPLGDDQPRFLITDAADTQQVFGVDVFAFSPGATETRELNATHARGYPILRLADVPDDDYWVQAVLQPYTLYSNRSDGQRLWLPGFDTFESTGGVLTAPGTLFSAPQLVSFSAASTFALALTLDRVEPPLPPLVEPHELLKHVTFRSPLLSTFWGVDVFLKAWVLLPYRFFDRATRNVKYPLFVYHTHYGRDFEFGFRATPPSSENSSKSNHHGTSDWYSYYLFQNWTSDAPDGAFTHKRGIIVQLQHANPYYDDSYAVNSASIGPYGDAITREFVPFLEAQYRGIGAGWARTMYGGSTGGWESLAVQVYYPDAYNGCWSFCPDAFDFHAFQIVDLYDDANAYYDTPATDWPSVRTDRGAKRTYLGKVVETMAAENHHELALGSRGRSGGQWDAWQAVYSPLNASDGHPAEIWDKESGDINHATVAHWHAHYDVRAKLEREWNANGLGAKLARKLHVFVGVADSFYLNDAVYALNAFLQQTTAPFFNGSVEFGVHDGEGYEHCWTGDNSATLSMAWNTLNQRIVPQMVDHIVATAPPNADLSFTSY